MNYLFRTDVSITRSETELQDEKRDMISGTSRIFKEQNKSIKKNVSKGYTKVEIFSVTTVEVSRC